MNIFNLIFVLIGSVGFLACEGTKTFESVKTLKIEADGPNIGEDPYEIIREKLGPNAIESPDVFVKDHHTRKHIQEDTHEEIGPHFVFTIHLNKDGNRGEYNGTQRNEIKVYRESKMWLKADEGETFQYRWKIKIDKNLKMSSNFCHFFQLHPVNLGDHPLITLSAKENKNESSLQFRYKALGEESKAIVLGEVNWDDVRGKWVKVVCQVTFADAEDGGEASMTIVKEEDKTVLMDVKKTGLDLWYPDRDERAKSYIRPKWGIVRSITEIKDKDSRTEKIRFANLRIALMGEKK